MTQPVGDQHTARTEAVGDGPEHEPVPTNPADAANAAEDAARRAVEGIGLDHGPTR